MDVCLLQRILSHLLKASIDSPFLHFMSFSVSKILPRYFMVFHSLLPSVPTQNPSVFSVLIFTFVCLFDFQREFLLYCVLMLFVSCYVANIVSILKINAEVFFTLAVICSGLIWLCDCIWILQHECNCKCESKFWSACTVSLWCSYVGFERFSSCISYLYRVLHCI